MTAVLALVGRAFAYIAGSPLGQLVLNFVWNKLVALVKRAVERARRKKEIQERVEKSVEPLKRAETADEIAKATDQALDDF